MLDEQAFSDFKCPHCDEDLSFPETTAGTAQECPMCFESIVVPDKGVERATGLPLPIQTSRLVLRRYEPGDWSDVLEFMSDEELFRYVDWSPLDEAGVIQWLEADRNTRLTHTGGRLSLGIELSGQGKVIGAVSIAYRDEAHMQAGFTVLMSRDFQRKGYGVEAATAVMAFCFRNIGLHRLTAECDSRNTGALHLLDKIGMRREGEFLHDRNINGEWANTVYFGLLKEEYAH